MDHKEQNPTLPNVFSYTDYRRFLRDYYDQKKGSKPEFSYRSFSRRAGFLSPSILLLVMKGNRNLTQKSIDSFCRAMGLNDRERIYFETLVHFNQASDEKTRQHYYEQILPIYKKEYGAKIRPDQYAYLSKWYGPVIREMIALPDFRESPKWISKKLGRLVSPEDCEKMVELLLELDLIGRQGDGSLYLKETTLTTPAEVENLSLIHFHEGMLQLALKALKEVYEIPRETPKEISGITLALSIGQAKRLQQQIQEFQNKILVELENNKEPPTEVYQMNFQLFSLTKRGPL